MKNRKAQTPFTIILWVVVAAIAFALFLGPWLAESSAAGVNDNNLTGWEGFWLANMPLWVIIIGIIFVLVVFGIGGGP